ncbi:MAG: hypothetical protein M3N52_11910 [Actinomycetota bacterium]|nr:hypothetical protein [Actinomycetota bacterium]
MTNRWRAAALVSGWANLIIAVAAATAGHTWPFFTAGLGAVLCFAATAAL